jgi:hypothetical protein
VDYLGTSSFAIHVVVAIYRRVKKLLAGNWPTAPGRVEMVMTQEIDGGIGRWWGELGYSFYVDGERYAGWFRKACRNENVAADFVSGWKDVQVPVRYRKSRPDDSMLLSGDLKRSLQYNAPHLAARL